MEDEDFRGMPDWDRVYRPGVEFSSWPVAKWERGLALSQELRAEYNAYRQASGDETTVKFSDDRKTAIFHARLSHKPPIERWSLLFGDALHNYRSSLDGLAWELAHLDGRTLTSKEEKSLYFPLAQTEVEWERMQRGPLSNMPPIVLSRLGTVQPYRVEPVKLGIGVLLHKLDIQDKHRAALPVELRVMDRQSLQLAYRLEGTGDSKWGGYEFVAPPRQVEDGDEVFRFREVRPFESAAVEKLPMVLGIILDKEFHNIFEFLDLTERQVAGTFISACVGHASLDWEAFIAEGAVRPETPWYPNVSRYPPPPPSVSR